MLRRASEGYPKGIRRVSLGPCPPSRSEAGRTTTSPPSRPEVLTALAEPLFKRNCVCRRISFMLPRTALSRRNSAFRFLHSTFCILHSTSNRVAFRGVMIYHAGRHTDYGLKSRANGRDAESENVP